MILIAIILIVLGLYLIATCRGNAGVAGIGLLLLIIGMALMSI